MSRIEQYEKLPVKISAIIFTDETVPELEVWLGGQCRFSYNHDARTFSIGTLEGVMIANVGDYIIKGVNGEFYPCKPDIFAKTYKKVS